MDFDLTPAESPAEDRHRPGFGWAIFVVVILFLVAMQLGPYFERKSDASSQVKPVAQAARLAFFQGEMQRRLSKRPDFSALDQAVKPLRFQRTSNPEAALLYAVAKDVSGKKLSAEDLAPLWNANQPNYRRAAEILRASMLTPSEAERLTASLPAGFEFRLLKVAALKRAGHSDPLASEFSAQEVYTPMVLGGLAGLAVLGGIVVLFVHRLMVVTGRLTPVGFPRTPINGAGADRYAGKAGLAVFLIMTLPALILAPIHRSLSNAGQTLVAGLTMLAVIAVFMAIPLFGKTITWREVGWRRDRLGADFLAGVAAALANLPILIVTALVSSALFRFLPPAEHPITKDPSVLAEPVTFLATLFVASIVAPIVEETIFRGMVSPAMAHVFQPRWVGWIVSGLCFAAIHPTGIPAWAPLAMLGVVASATNYQTGSLVSSVFMHGLHNAALLGFTLLFFS